MVQGKTGDMGQYSYTLTHYILAAGTGVGGRISFCKILWKKVLIYNFSLMVKLINEISTPIFPNHGNVNTNYDQIG